MSELYFLHVSDVYKVPVTGVLAIGREVTRGQSVAEEPGGAGQDKVTTELLTSQRNEVV